MSKQSKDMRDRASRQLRESRNGGLVASKADNVKRAASFKQLAENEEWLAGEKPRTKKRDAKQSQLESPVAYAPHEDEAVRARSGTDPARKKTGEF